MIRIHTPAAVDDAAASNGTCVSKHKCFGPWSSQETNGANNLKKQLAISVTCKRHLLKRCHVSGGMQMVVAKAALKQMWPSSICSMCEFEHEAPICMHVIETHTYTFPSMKTNSIKGH